MVWGHSSAPGAAHSFGIPSSSPPQACSLATPARRSDIMLTQMNPPNPSAVGWSSCVMKTGYLVLEVIPEDKSGQAIFRY